MDIYKNEPLTPTGQAILVRRVLDEGPPPPGGGNRQGGRLVRDMADEV